MRACIARREFRRLKKLLLAEKEAKESKIQSLTRYYEEQLAVERTRNETLHLAWADRWLQRERLATLSVSTSLIQEKALQKLPPIEEKLDEIDQLNLLSPNQRLELEERRDQFFQDGRELGKSPPEINNRWKDIQADVIADIKMAVN